jgi:hypothetical protein
MDGRIFDDLTRAASNGNSRRGALKLMAGAALTAAIAKISPVAAKKKGKGKNKKKKCRKLNQGCGGKKKRCCKGLTCTDGTCLKPAAPECDSDNDCGANEICQNGSCVPEPECDSDNDCDDNEICDAGVCLCPEIEDGRCIRRCESGVDCPGASECTNLSPEDAQTIVDGACVDIGILICSVPPCTANSECSANEICVMLRCDGDIPVGRCHPFSVF